MLHILAGRPSRPLLSILLAFTAAFVTGAAAPAAFGQEGPPPTPVRVDAVRLETLGRVHPITGEVEAQRRSVVAAEEEGSVVSVPFDVGQSVREGDVLAELDAELLTLTLRQMQAERAEAQAQVAEQREIAAREARDVEILLGLLEETAARPREVEDARSEAAAALAAQRSLEQRVALSEARIEWLKRRLANMTVRAPFDGLVVAKRTEVGEWVDAGGAVVELIAAGPVDAVIDVPEALVGGLSVGMPLDVRAAALGERATLGGAVRAIVPQADPRARTFPVKVELPNPDGRILPGMSVTAWVPSSEMVESLTMPRDAVLMGPTGQYVYVVQGDAVFPVPVEVQSGAGPERFVVVSASGQPLPSGTRVVVEGNERLYPSARVQIVHDAGADADADADANAMVPSSASTDRAADAGGASATNAPGGEH